VSSHSPSPLRSYLQWDNLLTLEEVEELRSTYDRFLDGSLDVARHRYDLGAGAPSKAQASVENITQIMWPSDILPALRDHPMRARALALVRSLYNDDTFDFDFDMLISKAPHTNTPTPAHQDQAYWIELEDKRAVSMWVALDESTLDNGCMWYGPGTHEKPLRAHRRSGAASNSALECDAEESEMRPMPLQPGSAGLHAGRTLHYSRGNTTATQRRAYILNFRPRAMIEYERAHGFDHGRAGNKVHEVRSTL
jgi:phytanoyl-CoA hydroxylase